LHLACHVSTAIVITIIVVVITNNIVKIPYLKPVDLRKMKKKKYDVVHVKWLDPFTTTSWAPLDHYKKDHAGIVSHTVGVLIFESKKTILVALNWSDEAGNAADVQTIMKCVMVSKKKIGTICV